MLHRRSGDLVLTGLDILHTMFIECAFYSVSKSKTLNFRSIALFCTALCNLVDNDMPHQTITSTFSSGSPAP